MKAKIDATTPGPENEKKDDSGNETGAGEVEPEEEPSDIVHYDKAKSFFDNISCEAVERSKGSVNLFKRRPMKLFKTLLRSTLLDSKSSMFGD